jgi:hypothetical protein
LRVRLSQFDLIWNAIDDEKQIALVDDVAVLEADLSERAADLGAQLKMVHGRELPQEFEPAVHVTLQRRADGNLRWRRGNGSTWCLYEDASCVEDGDDENYHHERQAGPECEARLP